MILLFLIFNLMWDSENPGIENQLTLADKVFYYQSLLEIYAYFAVLLSSGMFIFLCNLVEQTSFILSEYDIYHRKNHCNYHYVEFIELRFIEQNKFCVFAGPFFVNFQIWMLSGYQWDAKDNYLLISSAAGLFFGSIFFFIEIRSAKCLLGFKKFAFLLSLCVITVVLPPLFWVL